MAALSVSLDGQQVVLEPSAVQGCKSVAALDGAVRAALAAAASKDLHFQRKTSDYIACFDGVNASQRYLNDSRPTSMRRLFLSVDGLSAGGTVSAGALLFALQRLGRTPNEGDAPATPFLVGAAEYRAAAFTSRSAMQVTRRGEALAAPTVSLRRNSARIVGKRRGPRGPRR